LKAVRGGDVMGSHRVNAWAGRLSTSTRERAATLERRERKPDLEDEALDMDAERVKLFSALAAEADDEGAELDVGEQDDKAEHE
jgi:hypothetical protein